jgi:hypothetical protein
LYADSREEYDRQIGIPIGLVVDLIKRDATIIGTVVDKISKYNELRWYTTTYFIRADSVIFSYFPINIGDTLLVQSQHFGGGGVPVCVDVRDYRIGDSGYCFPLTRQGYVRHLHDTHLSHMGYCDPFCTNSFTEYLKDTTPNCTRDADPQKVYDFVKKIKKWY